jgi:hypothetical protein
MMLDLAHARMHRQRLGLEVLPPAEQDADGTDRQPDHEDVMAGEASSKEGNQAKVRDFDVSFARTRRRPAAYSQCSCSSSPLPGFLKHTGF